jgi:hypothetical protein
MQEPQFSKIPDQQFSYDDSYEDAGMYNQAKPDSDELVYKQTPSKRMGMRLTRANIVNSFSVESVHYFIDSIIVYDRNHITPSFYSNATRI